MSDPIHVHGNINDLTPILTVIQVTQLSTHYHSKRIGGVMVSMLALSSKDRGFEPRSGQNQDYEIGIYYFSTRLAALRRKSKIWLALNHDNVSEWEDMTIRRLFFQ
jgi:hypothetical protein